MRIKTKVAFGVAFLFFVIITVGGLGLYYLSQLSDDAKNILTNNYESLVYTQEVIKNCDSLLIDSLKAAQDIERNISLQEQNITEPGERQATAELRQAFEKIKNQGISQEGINALRKVCLKIQDLNMQAIVRKMKSPRKLLPRRPLTSWLSSLFFLLLHFHSSLIFRVMWPIPSCNSHKV